MKISIAMATYNGSKYLGEQLQSFLDQVRRPDELIISDDCSSDHTIKIIKDFAKKAPFDVRIFRNEVNLGYSDNFNAALMKTSGDLVFLSDQDDVWFSEKISFIENSALHNCHKLIFMNDAMLTDANLNQTGLTKLNQIRSAGLDDSRFIMGCCCAIRRELLDLCLPIPTGYTGHDNWISQFADGLDVKIVYDKVLQFYRRHADNHSQFFANRLTRATKLSWYKDLFISNWPPLSEDEEVLKLRHKEQLLIGVVQAIEKDNGLYADRLRTMEEEILDFLTLMYSRIEIRRKSILKRVCAVFLFLLSGRYKNTRGIISIVRDIVG